MKQTKELKELDNLIKEIKTKKEKYDKKLKETKVSTTQKPDPKIERLKKRIDLKQKYLDIKPRENINILNFKSDDRYRKEIFDIKWYNFIKKRKIKSRKYVLVIFHRQDNLDQAKLFPIKNHIVDINNEKYLFNPEHFRYINGFPVLYFYDGNPFAKVINVNDGYQEPTISSEALNTVLTSKYVMDAVKGESQDFKPMIFLIIIIVLMVINMIFTGIVFAGMDAIKKSLGV